MEKDTPRAFICHSSKDKPVVKKLATELRKKGVDAWYDDWEIKPGDSLRRKIDDGIEGADFFLAVLSRNSLKSEWVQTELDAGMIKRIEGSCRLVPVLLGIKVDDLSPLLRAIKCAFLDDFQDGLSQIVDLCFGLSTKPLLGDAPALAKASVPGLSNNASAIARYICEKDETGAEGFAVFEFEDISSAVPIQASLIEEALDELEEEGMVRLHRSINFPASLSARNRLFWNTDPVVKGWAPKTDAKALASALVNTRKDIVSLDEAGKALGWEVRRLNPAATYLVENEIVKTSETIGTAPYAYAWLQVTPRTRRFATE